MNLLLDMFIQFSLLAFVAFGGATALLPELHRLVVEQRHWMDETTFTQLFALAQAAPGPNVLVVTLIGWKVAGLAGALAATLALCLPMSVAVFLLFRHWDRLQGRPWRAAIQRGAAPLAVGLVFSSGLLIVGNTGAGWRGLALAALTALMAGRAAHPLLLIALGAGLGAAGIL